jgi:hypothetical protein
VSGGCETSERSHDSRRGRLLKRLRTDKGYCAKTLGESDATFTPNAPDVLTEYLNLGKVGRAHAFFSLRCAPLDRLTGARGCGARPPRASRGMLKCATPAGIVERGSAGPRRFRQWCQDGGGPSRVRSQCRGGVFEAENRDVPWMRIWDIGTCDDSAGLSAWQNVRAFPNTYSTRVAARRLWTRRDRLMRLFRELHDRVAADTGAARLRRGWAVC